MKHPFFSRNSLLAKAFTFISLAVTFGCGGPSTSDSRETTSRGTARISADESFKPVIDDELVVFHALYANAHIIASYKPEAECLRDLESDSTRMVIVTRGLTDDEKKLLEGKFKFAPLFGLLAYDAIAVIMNNGSKDSLLTMDDLRSVLKGTGGKKYKVVMDGTSSTSTVRYIIDSVLSGGTLGPNVVGAKGSRAVIDYVAENKDALGLIGVGWIGNKDDSSQLSYLKRIKVVQIERTDEPGKYIYPNQANIYLGRYPMIRPLYYILKENFDGIGSGFRNFLIYERGQKIFKRDYLLPARMRLDLQPVQL